MATGGNKKSTLAGSRVGSLTALPAALPFQMAAPFPLFIPGRFPAGFSAAEPDERRGACSPWLHSSAGGAVFSAAFRGNRGLGTDNRRDGGGRWLFLCSLGFGEWTRGRAACCHCSGNKREASGSGFPQKNGRPAKRLPQQTGASISVMA